MIRNWLETERGLKRELWKEYAKLFKSKKNKLLEVKNMKTKSRYEVISDLEQNKRNLIREKMELKDTLKTMKRKLTELERDVQDQKEEIKDFEKDMKARREMIDELIKGVDESLKRFTAVQTAQSKKTE